MNDTTMTDSNTFKCNYFAHCTNLTDIVARGSKFKAHGYDEVVRPGCMPTAGSSMSVQDELQAQKKHSGGLERTPTLTLDS